MQVKPTEFPIEVKRGSFCVRIRRVCPSKNYPDYFTFVLDYHEDGKRQRPSFATLKEARKEAEEVATRLARGDTKALVLTGTDRLMYLQAVEALAPHGLPLGVAAAELEQALTILKGRGSIVEAVRYYASAHGTDMKPISVRELVADLLRTREANHASQAHLKDLRFRLKTFADDFQCEVHLIRPAQVQDFLTALKLSPRSANNYRTAISNLFGHARLRNHAPKDFDPLADIPWAKVADKEVEIYTPEELKLMFERVKSEMLPYLAIAAFAGLRQAEISRLDWNEIKEEHIVILGDNAKTRTKRHAPITPNLAAWLRPYRQHRGAVMPFKNAGNELWKLARACGVQSKHNGLRHSYGSYRLAVLKDPAQLSYEMGNTTRMVFKHYRRVVEETQGVRWFSLSPGPTGQPVFLLPPPTALAHAA